MRQKTKMVLWIVVGPLLIISVGTAQNTRQELDREVPTEEVKILAGIAKTPAALRKNTAKIEFRAVFAKNQFYLLEPVSMIAKFRNPTSEILEIYEPNFQDQLGIKFSGNEKDATEKVRFKYYLNVPAKIIKLAPGEVLEKTVILSPGYNLFGNKGPVEVQFYLSNLSKQTIWSNKINIEVVEPTGTDREALDYLMENLGSESDLFTPKVREEEREALTILKTFLEKYEHSAYSDFARLAFGQTPENGKKSSSVPDGTLTVKLDKSEYALLEPIVARFSLRLPSAEVVGDLSRSTSIRVSYGDGTKEFNSLRHHVIIKDPTALPPGVQPSLLPKDAAPSSDDSEHVKEEIIDRIDEFFPQPGSYQLQFFVHTNAGNTVASNIIGVTVREPTGTDKAAYEILRLIEKPLTFYWVWEEKDGLKRLQEFATLYKDTVYGDYAVLHLGDAYLAKGEFAKAEIEFKKIRSSKNTYLAKIADRAIDGIRKQKNGMD